MINKKYLLILLVMAAFLRPTPSCADAFSSWGTRWPSGLKKTLTVNNQTLYSANGDILAAYGTSPFKLTDRINLKAPQGIIAIDVLNVGPDVYVVAACATGGLQVIPCPGSASPSPAIFSEEVAVVTESTITRANTPGKAALDIKGCAGFKSGDETFIATIDDNFGYRVFRLDTAGVPVTLTEIAQMELSEEHFTMLVDLAAWKQPMANDRILAIAKNREIGIFDMRKDLNGTWHIIPLAHAGIDIPSLPSTQLLYFSSLTLAIHNNTAHVIENSLGFFFSFALGGTLENPSIHQAYPPPATDGISLGYPLDIAVDGTFAYITTLMEKAENKPGVQVLRLSNHEVIGTYPQTGAGGLCKGPSSLFLMALENGLTKLDISDPKRPRADLAPLPTPFAAFALLANDIYLFMADGLENAEAGLRILDISNATQPKLRQVIPTAGKACDIAVDGDTYRLYIADGEAGVQCYSMNSNLLPDGKDHDDFGGEGQPPVPSPEAPCLLQTLSADDLGGTALKVTVTYKMVDGVPTSSLHILTRSTADTAALVSIEIPTDKTAPGLDLTKKKGVALKGSPMDMAPFLRDYILVATGSHGVLIVDLFSDIDNPTALQPAIKTDYTSGLTHTVRITSDGKRYAYVADDSAGVVTLDLFSNQNTPSAIRIAQKVRYKKTDETFVDLFATANNNLYTITDTKLDNIQIFDISDPAALTLINSETTLGSPQAIVAATTGGLIADSPTLKAAYVADGQGGLAVRQTTDDNNAEIQTWDDKSTSCFIGTLH